MLFNRLRTVGLMCALFACAPSEATFAASTSRPNVLLLMGDDHAAYALGCYGSRVARTPRLDRLASEGALFSRAFCNSPVCTASRQSLLTGRLPHATGVTLLSTPLADREITLAKHLKSAGYETAAIGKMHFNSRLKHGFDGRIDHAEYQVHRRQTSPAPLAPDAKTFGAFRPFKDPARVWLNSDCLPQPARGADMDATFFAQEANRFLRQPRRQPFFLMVSFYQPHSPFQFPLEYADLYRAPDLSVPEPGPNDAAQIPLVFRDLTRPQKQGINAAYYTSVAFLDRSIGLVLDALRESGHDGDTLVIYASDHGYNLGHHGRFEKHCFYEEAVRVPLLVRWPGHIAAARKIDALTELVDLVPTIIDACGLDAPPGRHGQSLLPLLLGKSKSQTQRKNVVSQYHENEEAMVRTDRWKLVYCTGQRGRQDGYATDFSTPGRYTRLFDLKNDPQEFCDLSQDSRQARRVQELKRALLARLESSAAPDLKAPGGLSLEESLDWYLVPPESRKPK